MHGLSALRLDELIWQAGRLNRRRDNEELNIASDYISGFTVLHEVTVHTFLQGW